MENYPANSHKAAAEKQEEAKRAQKVISGKASVKKKSEAKKFAEAFFNEDLRKIKNYVLMDVILPNAKKVISEVISNTVDMLLYGSPQRRDSGRSATRPSYVAYDRFAQDDNPPRREQTPARRAYSYEDILFDHKEDAAAVLKQLDDMMREYRQVSVADLYDLAGISHDYTDNDYGWKNIRNAEIVRLRDGGYTIKMPRPIPLDR